MRDAPDRRQETALGILGVNARLDGVPAKVQRVLHERQRLARRDPQLPLDQVEPGNHFGDRMLDLQARVHLHEVEQSGFVDDELDGAGTDVSDRLRRCHRRRAHFTAPLARHPGRRRFLEDFLMPALDRAVALEKMHAMAMRVCENLHFDVPWPVQILFQQHLVVAEAGFRLPSRRGQCRHKIRTLFDDAHALAASPGGCLDQHRVTNPIGLAGKQGIALVDAMIAGHQADAGLGHDAFRFRFGTHRANGGWRRANEDEPSRRDCCGKCWVLGQKAVAGMDRLRAHRSGDFDNAIAAQITLLRRRRPETMCFIASGDVKCAGIGVRIHRDGADSHAPRGARDAASDLAAIGDQNAVKHRLIFASPNRSVRRREGRARFAPTSPG